MKRTNLTNAAFVVSFLESPRMKCEVEKKEELRTTVKWLYFK